MQGLIGEGRESETVPVRRTIVPLDESRPRAAMRPALPERSSHRPTLP
jgi:hypothetical protein